QRPRPRSRRGEKTLQRVRDQVTSGPGYPSLPDEMEMKTLPVIDQSHCAVIRREATRLARDLGFDETETGNVAIVSTEVATNLLKHAGSGEVLLRSLLEESR